MLGEPGLPRWDWQRRSELGVLWLRFFFSRKTNKAKSAKGSGTQGGVQRKLGQLASAFPVKSRRTQSIGPVIVKALAKWLPP